MCIVLALYVRPCKSCKQTFWVWICPDTTSKLPIRALKLNLKIPQILELDVSRGLTFHRWAFFFVYVRWSPTQLCGVAVCTRVTCLLGWLLLKDTRRHRQLQWLVNMSVLSTRLTQIITASDITSRSRHFIIRLCEYLWAVCLCCWMNEWMKTFIAS